MSISSLRSRGIKVLDLIAYIKNDSSIKPNNYSPLTKDNLCSILGLEWLSSRSIEGHKKVVTKCTKCSKIEELDYGTLQRMIKANNKLCRYCRTAGGKKKDIKVYDTFDGYMPIKMENSKVYYKCNKCEKTISRSLSHVNTSEYIVCEYCNPNVTIGTKISTKLGEFDSYIEYLVYEKLLSFLEAADIERQVSYNKLFNTNTKHTADFYIKSLDLVLEVTTKNNKIREKYYNTVEWKKAQSKKVLFIYSLSEVDDIVRPLVKARG